MRRTLKELKKLAGKTSGRRHAANYEALKQAVKKLNSQVNPRKASDFRYSCDTAVGN